MKELTRKYPVVECNLTKLRHNMKEIISRCGAMGISVTGVIKGYNGNIETSRVYREGTSGLASSRMEQIVDCIQAGIPGPYMMIRIPMPGEVEDVVRYADSALVSELSTIRLIDEECASQRKKPFGIIMMADLGDLREGFWDKDEMVEAAVETEKMEHVRLLGVGVNLGCYGAIVPTPENLGELVSIAERIEARVGRRLEIISGGATTSLPLVLNGTMPKRVNHLRIGEGILQGKDLNDLFKLDMGFLDLDVFTVKAEVLEVKVKPSHPVGQIFVDAYGFTPEYPNRGMRRRALVGIGKLDFAFCDMLVPRDRGIGVLGGSSDHLILDVEDYEGDLKPGDILTFDTRYATMMYVTNSRYVRFVCTE